MRGNHVPRRVLPDPRGRRRELPTAVAAAAKRAHLRRSASGEQPIVRFETPRVIRNRCIEILERGGAGGAPAAGLPELRRRLAEKLRDRNGISCSVLNVTVTPGERFARFAAIAALCGPGDEVIIPAPYWLSYPEMVKATGAKVVAVETKAENNYELTAEQLEAAITPNTKLLILTTPSNPTGAVYRKETLEAIARVAVVRNIMVLADEIYEKLVYDANAPHISIASLNPEIADLTITCNGFSKTYSMTGWRLGYLTAPLWLAKRIIAFQSHSTSNPTTFVQWAGITALKEASADVERMRKAFAERRDLIYNLISEIDGVKCIRPQGAFYLFCDISSFGLKSDEFCERLLAEEMLAVIPGKGFGADGCIRLSYACSESMIREAARRLAKFCAALCK